MTEGKEIEIDSDWFTKNKIQQVERQVDARLRKEMAEIEKLLRDYLVAMLELSHRQLIRGRITLSEYYRTTQLLAYCAERVNKACEEEI